MLRLIDRYILREVIPPFALGLLVFTFLLMIPPIMEVAEELIAKGVDGVTILRLMVTLIPQGLGVTIPISLLIGVLMGLGRLSSDREAVALQACGVSLLRMLRPLLVLGALACLATFYILSVALPDANQTYREITFRVVADRAEGEMKPRVFDDGYFPGVVLYVREVSQAGDGWSDVFLADTRQSVQPDVYVAARGRVLLDRDSRRVEVVLENGTRHQVDPAEPDTYEVQAFDELVIKLDADSVFPSSGPQRGYREMAIPQLREQVGHMESLGLSPHGPIMELHKRFSIPVACLVFVIVGLGLGVTSRKDGKLASFALGISVIFAYYVLMYGGEALTKGQWISPHFSMWLPNIVLGLVGIGLIIWRSTSVERRLMHPWWMTRRHQPEAAPTSNDSDGAAGSSVGLLRVTTPSFSWLSVNVFNILDRYVIRVYLGIVSLSFVGLLGIFYISTFIDLSDKLFKGQTSGQRLLEYFWYATPQFAYYVLPISALVATLVTVGLLTKTSELTVMKACGISLYRAVLPIFLLSLAWSGVLFGMSESVLASANRRAEALNREIRSGVPAETNNFMQRRWVVSGAGAIYHYLSFDPDVDEFGSFSAYDFKGRPWTLTRRTFAAHAKYDPKAKLWEGHDVWVRDFGSDPEDAGQASSNRDGGAVSDTPERSQALASAPVRPLPFLESPEYFETQPPDAELMNVRELGEYVDDLQASGFDVVQLVVELHRKVSFPFVTLVLTLIAVPFAVTMGPRGALYGVGVGISLACAYWIIMSVFGAIGSAGMLAPALAAWAPNLLFGASATYLLLTVRT